MREVLIISAICAAIALALLVKAARHTWHIEVLKQQRDTER
jgi:hypothetical protein